LISRKLGYDLGNTILITDNPPASISIVVSLDRGISLSNPRGHHHVAHTKVGSKGIRHRRYSYSSGPSHGKSPCHSTVPLTCSDHKCHVTADRIHVPERQLISLGGGPLPHLPCRTPLCNSEPEGMVMDHGADMEILKWVERTIARRRRRSVPART
jgi:hypothetical protein